MRAYINFPEKMNCQRETELARTGFRSRQLPYSVASYLRREYGLVIKGSNVLIYGRVILPLRPPHFLIGYYEDGIGRNPQRQ